MVASPIKFFPVVSFKRRPLPKFIKKRRVLLAYRVSAAVIFVCVSPLLLDLFRKLSRSRTGDGSWSASVCCRLLPSAVPAASTVRGKSSGIGCQSSMDIKVTGVRTAAWITLVVLTGMAPPGRAASHIQDQIRAIAKQARGRVAIACSLPGVSLDCSFNEHAHPPMQSVFKLPLAMAVLHLAEQGAFTLDQPVHFAASDRFEMRTLSPLQDRYPQGEVAVPIRELTRLTIVESDNVASELLLKLVGGPRVVNDYIASLNVKGFHLLDGELSLHRNPDLQYRNWFEPDGAVQVLRLLADRSPLSRKDTDLLLGWMGQTPRGASRIAGALPRRTIVMHKPGSSGTEEGRTAAWNDIGLINLPDGRKMAVAVFITNSTADEQTRDAVIARISKALWDVAVSSR